MRVFINNGLGNVDYTQHVVDGSLNIEDSINVPTLITFQLSPVTNIFIKPSRSAYVTITSDILAPGGGYGSGKVLATGFITTEPERQFLGLTNQRGAFKYGQYNYNINVTSDEWLLNCNTVPFIPAFVNQTDSQILAQIANVLMPGFFNTSQMAGGTIIPFYQYDPSQTWSDIAKTFADANRFYYKVINKQIIYQPFGDKPLGISYDDQNQNQSQLAPLELQTAVVTVPPVNDCIVIGDVEPQTNWDNYYVGDGFTSNFQLPYQMFRGTSSDLLDDAWTETSFNVGQWTVNNPNNTITLVDGNGNSLGALNVVQKGSVGVYTPQVNATYIQAVNGLELAGGLNLQHGQVSFNDTASGGGGVIGGVYPSSVFLPGNVLCGFGITGQPANGPYTVTGVFVAVSSNIVQLTIINQTVTLQPGQVILCSAFTNATFLNGTKLAVQSVTVANNIYTVKCIGATTITAGYGPTADNGSIIANVNDVLVTASGAAGIGMQPIYSGAFVGPLILSQINHQYVLQTWIGAQSPTRYTRPYTNLTQTATFGNNALAASGTLSWVVTDYDLGVYVIEQQNPLFGLFPAAPPPVVTKYTVGPNVSLPPFALYCLVNGIDLNVSINYTDLALPPDGFLTVQSLTGQSGGKLPWLPSQLSVPIHYQLGFGMINQTAQISQQGEAFTLSFYTDDIPSVGARIRFQSWAAAQSISRVRDPIAIAQEARVSGDSGVRAAIMQNLSPVPRTSAECEAAAGAAILDREFPQFQGNYTVQTIPGRYESLYAPSLYDFPRTGRFLYINSQVRGITGQNFVVTTVRVQVVEMRSEVITISLDYGPDLYLEKLLPAFLEREQNLLVPTQSVSPPNPITLPQVLNFYLPTLDNAKITAIVNALSGDYIQIDLGAPPVTACEVRNVDNGWGLANAGRVGLFTSQVFTVPRTSRNQQWFLRAVNGPQFSRFSKGLNVQVPLLPSSPNLVSVDANTLVLGLAGDVRDIYGLELRASGGTFFLPPQGQSLALFNVGTFVGVLGLNIGSFYTAVGNYFPAVAPAWGGQFANPPNPFQEGDVIYLQCPQNSAFNGFKVVTTTSGPASPLATLLNGYPMPGEQYGWIDNYLVTYPPQGAPGFTSPIGYIGFGPQTPPAGTAELFIRPSAFYTISGMLIRQGGNVDIYTHETISSSVLPIGSQVCTGPMWTVAGFIFNHVQVVPPNAPDMNQTIAAGIWTVQSISGSPINGFTVNVSQQYPQDPWVLGGSGPNIAPAKGVVSPLPPGTSTSLVLAQGLILQKPVFAPADLVISLTDPDIQEVFAILEAQQNSTRIGGLQAFFFNLTWDYSAPLIINLAVPVVTGLNIDIASQTLRWSIPQGTPRGHRIVTQHPVLGTVLSKYTIDHPDNPQVLATATMTAADWANGRIITVTPFDALGDGAPTTVSWPGASGLGYTGGGLPLAREGDIIRFNVLGDNIWDAVNYAQPFAGLAATVAGLISVGVGSGLGAIAGVAGQNTFQFFPNPADGPAIQYDSNGAASTNTVCGWVANVNGNNVLYSILSYHRLTFKIGHTFNTNCRFWLGVANWNTGSSLGGNNVAIPGTAAFATDTPNKSMVGFRYSPGTDTTWKAVSCIPGVSPTVTVVDTGVAPVNFVPGSSPQYFEIIPTSIQTAVLSVDFYIDFVKVATISAPHLPATNLSFDSLGGIFVLGDNKNTANDPKIIFYYALMALK